MICSTCVGEAYLKARIDSEGMLERCVECGQNGTCLDIETLADTLETALDTYYCRTSNEPEGVDYLLAKEGRWQQPGTEVERLIAELLEANYDLGERLREVLSERHGFAAILHEL